MSSSRTNMRSAGKFAARAVRLYFPLSMRRPASRRRSRLRSARRPDRWRAMCRRVRSTDIGDLDCIKSSVIDANRILPQESSLSNDRRRADSGTLADLAVGKHRAIEQPRHVQALGEGLELSGLAKIAQQLPHLLAVAGRQ